MLYIYEKNYLSTFIVHAFNEITNLIMRKLGTILFVLIF